MCPPSLSSPGDEETFNGSDSNPVRCCSLGWVTIPTVRSWKRRTWLLYFVQSPFPCETYISGCSREKTRGLEGVLCHSSACGRDCTGIHPPPVATGCDFSLETFMKKHHLYTEGPTGQNNCENCVRKTALNLDKKAEGLCTNSSHLMSEIFFLCFYFLLPPIMYPTFPEHPLRERPWGNQDV